MRIDIVRRALKAAVPVTSGAAIGLASAATAAIAQTRRPDPIERPEPTARPGLSNSEQDLGRARRRLEDAKAMARKAKTKRERDDWELRASEVEQNVKRLERERGSGVAQPAPQAPAPVQQTPTQPQPVKAKSGYDTRREALVAEQEQMRRALAEETARGGFGPKSKMVSDRLKEISGELEKIDAQEVKNSPVRNAIAIALPVAAGVIGAVAGARMGKSAAKVAADHAKTAIKQVETLGRMASELVKGKKVIAGTPAGDKAKAIINEAYALGGVKSAFPSPAYQAPPAAKSVFQKMGAPSGAQYVVPGISVAQGGVALYASTKVEDENLRTALRTEGALAIAGGIFAGKALVSSRAFAPRPRSSAVAAIETARTRIIREQAAGAGQVGRNAIAAQAARSTNQITAAMGAAARFRNKTAASVDRSKIPAIAAEGAVRVARVRADMSPARALADGRTPGSTFQRTYTRGPKAGLTEIVKKPR